jgi:hypothetical protein
MRRLGLVAAIGLCLSVSALASPNVQFTDVYGWNVDIITPWYSGLMAAGIYKIAVDGTATDAFCIDPPDDVSLVASPYTIINLADGPDPVVGPMGTQKADAVRKLWAMAYSPGMTMNQAAALQIAIWDTVVDLDYNVYDGNFQINGYDYGAQALLNAAYGYSGPLADLTGLSSPEYQDFVVDGLPVVPAPGALWLAGIGLAGLARRRWNKGL